MGRRGPQPIPTAAKLRAGITAPSRLNLTEPIPRDRRPTIRRDWSTARKAIARGILAETARGQITAADQAAFEATVEAIHGFRLVTVALGDALGIGKGRDGEPVVSPAYRVYRDRGADMRLWLRELGLTPASRSSLHAEGELGVADGIEASIGAAPRLRAVAGGRPMAEDDDELDGDDRG